MNMAAMTAQIKHAFTLLQTTIAEKKRSASPSTVERKEVHVIALCMRTASVDATLVLTAVPNLYMNIMLTPAKASLRTDASHTQ